jgi:hypothetical protein
MRGQAIFQAYSQRTCRHSSIKIESHSEALPEIYKKYFHVVHVAINQLPIFGLVMHTVNES